MADKLIIWMADDPAQPETVDTRALAHEARWLVLDANGNRVGFPQRGALADAASLAANRRVTVMLPGEGILSATARVPGNNPQRILQAAPYALEERLAGDVEELHVALLARGADQQAEFLVVEKAALTACLERLTAAGIAPDQVWPDYLAVPHEADAAHWLLTADERLLCRDGEWSGFAAPVADAAFLYSHREENIPPRLTVVGDQPPPPALGELEIARLDDDERAFTELAATASGLRGPGLLQGEFRRRREGAADWRRWRWAAVAAGVWLLVGAIGFSLDLYRLQRENAFLEQATTQLFQQAFPGGTRMVDPRFQIEQALGSASGADSRLLDYLADIALSLQDMPNARLNGFNFRGQRLELSVTVPDAQALDRLRGALADRAGQPVEVQSANSTEGGLEGRLLLAGGNGK